MCVHVLLLKLILLLEVQIYFKFPLSYGAVTALPCRPFYPSDGHCSCCHGTVAAGLGSLKSITKGVAPLCGESLRGNYPESFATELCSDQFLVSVNTQLFSAMGHKSARIKRCTRELPRKGSRDFFVPFKATGLEHVLPLTLLIWKVFSL